MEFSNVSERRATTPPLGVSTVVFMLRPEEDAEGRPGLWLPLVRRTREPYRGHWALPGGPVRGDTSLRTAAADTLRDTTALAPRLLEQLYTFGGTDRGEGQRLVSVVYWALVRAEDPHAELLQDPDVAWFPAAAAPGELAFDHQRILDYALARLRAKVGYADVAQRLLGETFTLAQLRAAHEAILDTRLDPGNFRRTVLARGSLEDTGDVHTGGMGRPAHLYRAIDTRQQTVLPDPEGERS